MNFIVLLDKGLGALLPIPHTFFLKRCLVLPVSSGPRRRLGTAGILHAALDCLPSEVGFYKALGTLGSHGHMA